MPYHRRNKKRHRNKSSPQVLSSPKKHRSSKPDCDETKELTEPSDSESVIDSIIDSTLNSTLEDSSCMQSIPNTSAMISEQNIEQPVDMSQTSQDGASHVAEIGAPQQLVGAGPGVIDPSTLNAALPINFNPQQMMNFAQSLPQTHIQQLPQALPYPGLSEDDIMRVAIKIKMLLRDEINELVEQRVELVVAPLKNELDSVKASLANVEKVLKESLIRNDELEQYSRRSCLRITGIAESANEDVSKIVLDLWRRIKVDITPQDIDRAHRVGRLRDNHDVGSQSRNQNKGREIIVKFTNSSARLKYLKGRVVLRDENARIYINEDLTKARRDLAYECRRLQKSKCINKTWIYNGNVFINDNSDNKLRITRIEDLQRFQPNSADISDR